MDDVRLDEFDQDEWWDVCHRLKPRMTREEFDAMWADFQARKAAGTLEGQRVLQ